MLAPTAFPPQLQEKTASIVNEGTGEGSYHELKPSLIPSTQSLMLNTGDQQRLDGPTTSVPSNATDKGQYY